eukprot:207045_1
MKMKFFLVMFAILGRGLCDIADGDKNALLALYSSTNGAEWKIRDEWNSTDVGCDSYGVRCNDDGHVTQLKLSNNNLEGTIPSKLGGLTALTKLYLFRNNLYGEIPSELGGLTALRKLDLGDNHLDGKIPSKLVGLTALTKLYLSG